jgi:hypothetical protein
LQVKGNQPQLLDTIFQEDKQKMYDEDGASLLAILRRWALNQVKPHADKAIKNQNLNRDLWSDDFSEELMFGVG